MVDYINEGDVDGKTPLHVAITTPYSLKMSDLVELLLNKGANINARITASSSTPLHEAASKGRHDIIKLLRQHGADETRNADNKRPRDLFVCTASKASKKHKHEEKSKLLFGPL